jgi:hypothetical protein
MKISPLVHLPHLAIAHIKGCEQSSLVAAGVPTALRALQRDPKAASGPIVLAMTDITALVYIPRLRYGSAWVASDEVAARRGENLAVPARSPENEPIYVQSCFGPVES